MSRLFTDVQKFLQISIFFLESRRRCSPLFAPVGVKLVSDRFDLHFVRPLIGRLHYHPSSTIGVSILPDRKRFLGEISPRRVE